jgi:hypothetical protein
MQALLIKHFFAAAAAAAELVAGQLKGMNMAAHAAARAS